MLIINEHMCCVFHIGNRPKLYSAHFSDNITYLNIHNGSNNRGDSSSTLSSNGGGAEGTVSACYIGDES